jgi:hypothetical protein
MIRIDENTYIDDSLVICAEYQLFIDEMREKGKYYQPDHWTSYQFPKGHAKEPILGVRMDDGINLCEWLTEYKSDEWIYRLPRPDEGGDNHLKTYDQTPLGYWANDGNLWDFIWINGGPMRVRDLDLKVEDILDNSNDEYYDDIFNAIDRYQDEPLLLGKLNDEYMNSEILNVLNRNLSRDLAFSINYFKNFVNTFQKGSPEGYREIAAEMFIDIFTILERIAGRSPAFEAIRLVKERVKL